MRISDWSSDVCSSDLSPRLQRSSGSGDQVAPRMGGWLSFLARAQKQPFAQEHYPLRYLMVHRPEASSLPKTKQKPNTQQRRRYHCRDHSFPRNQQTCENDTYLVKLIERSTLLRLSFCLCLVDR